MMSKMLLLLLVLYSLMFAQAPEVTWFERLFWFGSEACVSIVDANSQLYMIGRIDSNFSVVALDYDGSVVWTKIYGGSEYDNCYDGSATSDGGLILAGGTRSYGAGNDDVWLVKLDSEGNQEWNSCFGTSDREYANSVRQTFDGGYIAVGSQLIWHENLDVYEHNAYMVKADFEGNLEWEKVFTGDYALSGYSIIETSDSCYLFSGVADLQKSTLFELLLVKTDSNGNIIWQNTYTYSSAYDCAGYSVIEASDGGFVTVGHVAISGSTDYEIYVLKTDSDGNEQWNQKFGGGTWYNSAYSVIETFEGGYAVSGTIWDQTDSPECFLRKIDDDGNTEWDCIVDGSSFPEHGKALTQLSDGGYVVGGYVVGDTTFVNDFFIARFAPPVGIEEESILESSNITINAISPNPFYSSVDISISLQEPTDIIISIFDLSGRRIADILTGSIQAGETTVNWDGRNSIGNYTPSGVYILRVSSDGTEMTEKLAVIR